MAYHCERTRSGYRGRAVTCRCFFPDDVPANTPCPRAAELEKLLGKIGDRLLEIAKAGGAEYYQIHPDGYSYADRYEKLVLLAADGSIVPQFMEHCDDWWNMRFVTDYLKKRGLVDFREKEYRTKYR